MYILVIQCVRVNRQFRKIIVYLKKSDPALGAVIDRVALPSFTSRPNHFRSLVEAIISQQLSDKAAATITKRFIGLFDTVSFPGASAVVSASAKRLRRAGISGAKVLYIKNIARAVYGGSLDFQRLRRLADEEVILELTKLKGVGRWTAEMFLMFSFRRPDIFSYGDLGLRNAMVKLYRIRGKFTPDKARKIALRWSPYRTYACRYLWASLRLK